MTVEEARAVLVMAYAETPDVPDDLTKLIADLVFPPEPVKTAWWRRAGKR